MPKIRGLYTQARWLDQVEAVTREAIALLGQLPAANFTLAVEPHLDAVARIPSAHGTSGSIYLLMSQEYAEHRGMPTCCARPSEALRALKVSSEGAWMST